MKTKALWLGLLTWCLAWPSWAVDRVEVDKSKRRMYLIESEQVVREYRIALGKRPKGHKRREGDGRTPEGTYHLDFIMEDSAYYRSMHIDYPNRSDRHSAKMRGVSPGGSIKIHGLPNGERRSAKMMLSFDWTNGCIAISNRDMDELIRLVKRGTPIHIYW